MSSAAARAEARRKAILARGSDRLSRLTTSARGEDAPQFVHDDNSSHTPPRPSSKTTLENFVGEQTPTPPSRGTPAPASNPFDPFGLSNVPTDPSAWSAEQQQQLLRALIGSSPSRPTDDPPEPYYDTPGAPMDDPLAALMANLPQQGQGGMPIQAEMQPPRPRTLLQKLLPLIHLLSVWALVVYFVLFAEPAASGTRVDVNTLSRRWLLLLKEPPLLGSTSNVQAMPFFWAFITLELCLHSIRIFTGLDAVQPPMLLALALPHLPAPFPSIITHTLKYLKMGSALLDDLAAAIFAFAICILLASAFGA